MSDVVIKIEDLYKQYRLGSIGGGTLQGDLQSWFARIRGKEDPNLKIGQDVYHKNEIFYALSGISLEIHKGDTLGLIGGNGAGKSTLLKILSRVTAPSKGRVFINGKIASMLEVGTGFHPELSGRDNVYLNGAILGMTKTEVDRKFDEIVDFSGLEKFIDTPVKRYSSGMYVKLAFSVAANLDSDILIMDEVLAVGDMKFQQKCLGKMGDVANKEGKTVIYVSHNMSTVRQLCNRCAILKDGQLVYDGNVESAISYYLDSVNDAAAFCDYTDLRAKIKGDHQIEMRSIQVLDKSDAVFERYEEPVLILKCYANRDLDGVYFRMETQYLDSTLAGTALTDKPISCKKGETFDVKIKLHINNLAPGKYQAAMLAYQTNNLGAQSPLDRIYPAVVFEVSEHYDAQDIIWHHQYFGHVKLDNMEILD